MAAFLYGTDVWDSKGRPVNKLAGEAIVIRLDFEDLDTAFAAEAEETEESRF